MRAMVNCRLRKHCRIAVAAIGCVLGLLLGCSRQESINRSTSPAGRTIPFHSSSDLESDASPDAKPVRMAPFEGVAQPGMAPAGTLLTVQLRSSLSASTARPGDTFLAVVAEPLLIDGKTLVDSGTLVKGRVESTRLESDHSPQLSYLRLALTSVDVRSRKVPLETSSLFARATAMNGSPRSTSVRLQRGHRLTFRLTAPLILSDQYRIASAAPVGQ